MKKKLRYRIHSVIGAKLQELVSIELRNIECIDTFKTEIKIGFQASAFVFTEKSANIVIIKK